MSIIPRSRLIIGVILLVFTVIFVAIGAIMLSHYDPISGLTFIATPTAFPVTIGNLPAEVKEKQRVIIEGHLVYSSSITSMDLGSYGWRDKLYLLRPATWEEIPIWFDSTTSTKKEPNQISGVNFNFRHEDIVVYDNQGQEVRPGDLMRVEGRLVPASSDWHLIVEMVSLLKAYPRTTLEEGYTGFGDVNLVDTLWTDDGRLMFIFQASKELSIAYAVEINGQTSECTYWNQMIYCLVQGLRSGENVQVDLYQVRTYSGKNELLFSEAVVLP
jgi:hypothetical protein